ncbi:hypothetical protein NQ317_006124 [Molorchus minor]|uniref:Uncharacterized protein n=1 Tax=Molorchus minor TaxID=1323400 RepID=A0ABQ9IXR4_9CUCU|nr:hypothetical protein NQ317_006124 [Molorchus minor]
MRKAILEGLDVKFAKIPLPPFAGAPMLRQGLPPPHCLPAMNLPSNRGGTSLRQRPISSRGGQLQVAGVVVGSWGANYGFQPNMRQVIPAGGFASQGRGRGTGNYQSYGRGRGQNRKPGPPTFPVNTRRGQQANKKRNTNKPNKGQKPQGLSLTVKTESGRSKSYLTYLQM